ncbi:LOW QUALITY PROTEIN: hypothetical protein O9K51_04254 [Purpureocillium lavendulum]|uniref:BRCT domain-containing protein n=1 Tax=Purpureocillium lavendulum TaxID=1247861 RepID=A0AB34FVU7_9HYPO|nr:LOW QUALITY PROTEIN: hypothetical protein O9K51_04254 [Purpureocillium lavendulum]
MGLQTTYATMESPPKRMTRARAAAKADESKTKTTKIVTAAAKAKTAGTATSSTKSTAAKRKTRSDENEDEEGQETVRPAVRGRPRKNPEANGASEESSAAAPAPPRAARGRPPKKATGEAPKQDDISAIVAPRPRGRPRKTPAPDADTAPAPATEPAKKTTRSRAAPVTKPSVKKTVKFEEPDKENLEPEAAKTKEPTTSGMRGRPARRGGATAARSTRTGTKAPGVSQKKPLSPKKVTQMPVPRDEDSSEDELAMEKARTPVRHLTKSPIKPPSSAIAVAKEPEATTEAPEPAVGGKMRTLDAPVLGATSPRRPPSSPFKDSLKSPAKRIGAVTLPGSALRSSDRGAEHIGQTPSFKSSLLRSAAKRPQSPIKGLSLPPASVAKPHQSQSAIKKTLFQSPAKRALPGLKPLADSEPTGEISHPESPRMLPVVVGTPTPTDRRRPSEKLLDEEPVGEGFDDDCLRTMKRDVTFSGRLSAVLPRHADPSLNGDAEDLDDGVEDIDLVAEVAESNDLPLHEEAAPCTAQHPPATHMEDSMALDDIAAEMEESTELPARQNEGDDEADEEVKEEGGEEQQPALLPDETEDPKYGLREKDQDPCYDIRSDSDSEDDTTEAIKNNLPTPSKSPRKLRESRRSTIGLTSLAEQFGSWSAGSPTKADMHTHAAPANACENINEGQETVADNAGESGSSLKSTFFEDEMLVHVDAIAVEPHTAAAQGASREREVDDPSMEDIMVTDEDVALAQEANDLSVMEPEHVEQQVVNDGSFDDSVSEASQEYGDENQLPVDPALAGAVAANPVTPARPTQHRTFFTTTKVPLKPADESTPSPLKQRSFSVSRVDSRRPAALPRSATVISYSPTKGKRRSSVAPRDSHTVTPSKSDVWSCIGTPARTPRRDLNPGLLRGAVVFVDVHTTEGADASGIFVELLSQMGARCVKSWHWNPSGSANSESCSPAKVGITHVVYKDGGKRTLEKVREARGVVHCVGVSWVLDCERENDWLEEAPYWIDTSHIPRGGARRRKSMEPKALANLNGTVVNGPSKAAHTPTTPKNRRDSSLWMHSPSDPDGQVDDDDLEWSCVLLTPVPKTPAPEAIAHGAAGDAAGGSDDEADSSPTKQALLTRTCPPKASVYRDMGTGVLSKDKDEHVLQRLMAARRKSLQFAPKIGSPLSKTWE